MRPPSAFTRRVPALSAVLLLMLTTTGAAPVIHSPRTGRVEGHVRARSGTPLANAQAFVVGSAVSALTDSAGRYVLPMVAEGSVTLRATFVGYEPAHATVTVRSGRNVTQDFTLEPLPVPAAAAESVANAAVGSVDRAAQGYARPDSKIERRNRAPQVAVLRRQPVGTRGSPDRPDRAAGEEHPT